MAENAFSVFFILVGLGALVVFAGTVFSNLLHIQAALRGELKRRPVTSYRVTLYRPMDHPNVVKRMGRRRQQDWTRTSPARQAESVHASRK